MNPSTSRRPQTHSRKLDAGTLIGAIGTFGGLAAGFAAIVLFALPAMVPSLRDVRIGNFAPFDIGGRLIGSTFTSQPYYPEVVGRIRHSAKFAAILGNPIAIDGGASCTYLSNDTVQAKANCNMPVHGPKAAAVVHVQIVAQSGSMDLGAWLHVGDKSISIDE